MFSVVKMNRDPFRKLDEGVYGLHSPVGDIASFIDGEIHLSLGPFDGLLGFFAETLCLSLEIIASVFKIIACVRDASAELLAGFNPGLGSIEKCDGGACANANAKSKPVVLCAHGRYLVLD
jgi:hypothetical protein